MAKYRKKPVTVEAQLFDWHTWNEVCDFLSGESMASQKNPGYYIDERGNRTEDQTDRFAIKVKTAQGQWVQVANREWIIAEGEAHPGRYYPCEPEIFKATYEPVDVSD